MEEQLGEESPRKMTFLAREATARQVRFAASRHLRGGFRISRRGTLKKG
jgi:hypothetical protein